MVLLKSKRYLRMRLKFTHAHLDNTPAEWKKVLWSNETKIELFGHNTTKKIWHKREEA